jgi:Kef-type K+ transport system membrane component KefB
MITSMFMGLPLAVAQSAAADLSGPMQRFVIQLAVILLAARLLGRASERWLGLPSVVGELFAGIAIGPYALGGVSLPLLGALFPLPAAGFPISPEIYAVATLASLLLLFMAGLDTDVDLFLRFSKAGSVVGLGGLVFSFAAGMFTARMFGLAERLTDSPALFLGVIAGATSVGITARVLAEQRKTETPESVTILTGAVMDDVLGIVLLAVVISLARVSETGGGVPWLRMGGVAARALGLWLACTVIGLWSARRFGRVLKRLGSIDVAASVALGLALLLAGILESAGLAMILGAYLLGLSLS